MIVELQDNWITFKYQGDDDITFQTQKNLFQENTGLTIANPDVDIPVYGLRLNQFGTSIICGHIIDNIIGELKGAGLENIILIVDFTDIVEISESFCEQYFRFLLTTKSKVISIHQHTNINIAFSSYIESVIEYQGVQ